MKTLMTTAAFALAAALVTSCSTVEVEKAAFDGLYFNVENVVEEFEVGETDHYVIYDDIYAGIDNEVIRLTSDTYKNVIEKIKNGGEFSGYLHPVKNNETIEYAL